MLPKQPRTLADLPAPDELASRRLLSLLTSEVGADAEAA